MTDCAHDVSLIALIVDGVAHGFPVNGQRFVVLTIGLVPALQGTVKMHRVDANQYVTDDGHARYDGALVLVSAAKTLPGLLSKAFGPPRDSQAAADLGFP
jgi:Na+-transporting NADH:ubiquinone oxidoreductase subunit NqrD